MRGSRAPGEMILSEGVEEWREKADVGDGGRGIVPEGRREAVVNADESEAV